MKKTYEKPAMEIMLMQSDCFILAGSPDAYGMNTDVSDAEVDEAW